MVSSETLTCLREIVGKMHAGAALARIAHWNVTGMTFGPLHELFGTVYSDLAGMEDTIAERVRALGGAVPTSVLNNAFPIPATSGTTAAGYIKHVLTCCKSLSACLQSAISTTDAVTSNILQDLCAKIDKHVWMLRAHLVKE